MKSSQVRDSLPLLGTASKATGTFFLLHPATKSTKKENRNVNFRPTRPKTKYSSKAKPFKSGCTNSLLEKKISPKQERKNALRNNWQFVYHVASAAMIISKLKKSTGQSSQLPHSSGIADYKTFLKTIGIQLEKRTESHIFKIARMIKPLKYVKDLNLPLSLIRELSRTAVVNTLKSGNNIILDGPTSANKYTYIILVGSVEVYGRSAENIKTSAVVGYKNVGDNFGNSSNPVNEEAFVRALEDCEMLILETKIMKELLNTNKISKAKIISTFFKQVGAFRNIHDYEIENLSVCASVVSYRPGEIIYKEGDLISQTNFFMIVKRGSVEAFKHIKNKRSMIEKNGDTGEEKNGGRNKQLLFVKMCHPYDIVTCRKKIPQQLIRGKSFKHKDMRNLRNHVTIRAKTMCECVVIPQLALYKRLSTKSINYLANCMPSYPLNIEANNQIKKKHIWENYKKQLVNDILLNSKRNGIKYVKSKSLVTKKSNRIFRSSQVALTVKAAKANSRLKFY
jgi:CRP-like cAMP-binding protein